MSAYETMSRPADDLPHPWLNEASFWHPDYVMNSPWLKHAPFAFWITSVARPRTLIELGACDGYSYFAFCQAVRSLGLETRCSAIYTGGMNRPARKDCSFEALDAYNQSHYSAFSRIVPSTLDAALPQFPDGSIDLLNIRGECIGDTADRTFDNWRKKLSRRSIVIIHGADDENGAALESGGWNELRRNSASFEFFHENGLLVVGSGSDLPDRIKDFFAVAAQPGRANEVRSAYERLGGAIEAERDRATERSVLDGELAKERDVSAGLAARLRAQELLSTELMERLAGHSVEASRLAASAEAKEAAATDMARQLEAAERKLSTLKGRMSWRVMAPFREVARFLRRSVGTTRGWTGAAGTPGRTRRAGKTSRSGNKAGNATSLQRRGNEPATISGPNPWRDQFVSWTEVRAEVLNGFAEPAEEPRVSVVVPVHNQFDYTLRCVWSILKAGDTAPLEIILADDCSSDETESFFSQIRGIRYLRNATNLGFLKTCNHAAESARGEYIYLLNNDTAVRPDWIDSLLRTFETAGDAAGLVGSKLVYPNGLLQEAGAIIWRDASGRNVGRNHDPMEPGYNYLRDVDYVSGAGIMIPAGLWRRLGGFDERYAPAYYEDSDLCMRIRQQGYRVLYQAGSEIVHFEGVSSGRSITEGVKAYQVVNRQKFLEKWRFTLELHAENSPVHPRALTRSGAPRVLIIDAQIPMPDKDAGSVIAFHFIKILAEFGYEITLLPKTLRYAGKKYAAPLQELGVEVLYRPQVSKLDEYIERYGDQFDLFIVYRVDGGGEYAAQIKECFPETPIIFDTVDLHYLRQEREARLPDAPADAVHLAKETKGRELGLIALCDDTVVLSTAERDLLVAEGVADDKLSLIPFAFETSMTPSPREGRNGIVFVGGYQHLPNVDAVLHFLRNIWPLVHEAMPDLQFHIVGSNPPPAIAGIRAEGVIVHGFVADLDAFLDQRIASIAPLQYGAGIKGKIGSSLAVGLPCVATAVAVEGMGLESGKDVLVADSPRKFAEAIAVLCRDDALWHRLSDAGRAFVHQEYSLAVTRKRLFRLMAKNNVSPFSGWCPISGTKGPRRFVDEQTPDSLTDRPQGPWSSERVLAARIARYFGEPDTALVDLSPAKAAKTGKTVAFAGRLPALQGACERLGVVRQPADLVCARVELDDDALTNLEAVLEMAAGVGANLAVACVGKPGSSPDRLAGLVAHMVADGWEVRTRRIPLAECVFTGCGLIEGRRARRLA